MNLIALIFDPRNSPFLIFDTVQAWSAIKFITEINYLITQNPQLASDFIYFIKFINNFDGEILERGLIHNHDLRKELLDNLSTKEYFAYNLNKYENILSENWCQNWADFGKASQPLANMFWVMSFDYVKDLPEYKRILSCKPGLLDTIFSWWKYKLRLDLGMMPQSYTVECFLNQKTHFFSPQFCKICYKCGDVPSNWGLKEVITSNILELKAQKYTTWQSLLRSFRLGTNLPDPTIAFSRQKYDLLGRAMCYWPVDIFLSETDKCLLAHPGLREGWQKEVNQHTHRFYKSPRKSSEVSLPLLNTLKVYQNFPLIKAFLKDSSMALTIRNFFFVNGENLMACYTAIFNVHDLNRAMAIINKTQPDYFFISIKILNAHSPETASRILELWKRKFSLGNLLKNFTVEELLKSQNFWSKHAFKNSDCMLYQTVAKFFERKIRCDLGNFLRSPARLELVLKPGKNSKYLTSVNHYLITLNCSLPIGNWDLRSTPALKSRLSFLQLVNSVQHHVHSMNPVGAYSLWYNILYTKLGIFHGLRPRDVKIRVLGARNFFLEEQNNREADRSLDDTVNRYFKSLRASTTMALG